MRTLNCAFILSALLLSACADQKMSFKTASNAGKDGGGVTGTNPGDATGVIRQDCQDQLQNATVPIKLLFVVDTSGSNVNDSANPGGSDPNKAVRGGSIQEFFNLYKTKLNFSWAFNTFADTTSKALIGASTSQPAFADAANMQNAISKFYTITDTGNTPYGAALDLAYKTINTDANRTQQTRWVVVFMSDGVPNPDVDQNTLNNKVMNLVSLLPGQITFNAVYYGATNATASGRLAQMVQVGGGKFLDTNANPTGKSFQIVDVINVPGTACR